MPHILEKKILNLLQSDCETCHQSNFATCRSLTPQTLVNRSLPKAFLKTKTFRVQATSKKIQKHSEVQNLCRNQVSKPSRTSTSKLKNI